MVKLRKEPKGRIEPKDGNPMKQALSTGKAAKYCFVTGDTVQNWIRSGIVSAQRTAGGQYRVRLEDLRHFMLDQGMSVQDLDRDFREEQPEYCWQYYRRRAKRHANCKNACESCVAKQAMALKCYELRKHVDHRCVHCRGDCSNCGYYRKYAEAAG